MGKTGRPPKYTKWITDEGIETICGWAEEGMLQKEIAEKIGINISTLCEWQRRFPQLSEPLNKARFNADEQVINAMFRTALGEEYEEEMVTPSGKVVTVKKKRPPNVTAQIFWAKNRRPNEWREKSETVVSGGLDISEKQAMAREYMDKLIGDGAVDSGEGEVSE